jgi:hypothetical protein
MVYGALCNSQQGQDMKGLNFPLLNVFNSVARLLCNVLYIIRWVECYYGDNKYAVRGKPFERYR